MKRVLCLILVAVMSIAGVAGAVAEESSPITIQFWNSFTGADGDLLVQLVDRFNAENQWGDHHRDGHLLQLHRAAQLRAGRQ